MASISLDTGKVASIVTARDSFVTTVVLTAISKLGQDCLYWDPEVAATSFEEEIGVRHISDRLYDKLQTGLMLIGTNAFTSTIEGFLAATKTMSNGLLDGTEAPFCSLGMCAWSIFEYNQLMGVTPDDADEKFAPEIAVYIQELGRINGISKFPEWMSFADAPAGQVPDVSGDVTLFEAYNSRQQDYVDALKEKVSVKQKRLSEQLSALKKAGVLIKPDQA